MALHKILTHKRPPHAGFTLIEILVVVALLATISGLGVVLGMDSYRGYAFRSDRDTLISLLERARAQSINNICIGVSCTNGKPHGVYIDKSEGRYVLFQGVSYAMRDSAADEVIAFSKGIQFSGLSEIVFAQLSGNVSTPGDVVLSGVVGKTSTTSVNILGRVSWI